MHVLIVSDDAESRTAVAEAANADGVVVETAETIESATLALGRGAFPLVFAHERLSGSSPADLYRLLRATPGGEDSSDCRNRGLDEDITTYADGGGLR